MEDLESQIAKIQLGNLKTTSSYVHVMAEQAAASSAELFVVAELPMFNPAAYESCERICEAIAAGLRRAYRKPLLPGSFETAIAQINEELGKLASLGQIHWLGKLNCIIAVREGQTFTVATCGKIAAFLFRSGEFTDISCSSAQSHPLKTFENYAAGKIRLGDLLVLSTTQLLNYVSMDRLKAILQGDNFLASAQTIIELIKDNAGPEAAFGTIMDLLVEPGQASEQEVDLENFVRQTQDRASSPAAKITGFINYLKTMLTAGGQKQKRIPQVGLPGTSGLDAWRERLKNLTGRTGNVAATGKNFWNAVGRGVAASRNSLKPQNIKQYSAEKKFFLAAAAILLFTVIISLATASHVKRSRQQSAAMSSRLKQAQTLIANAQASLLYNDGANAQNYFTQARSLIPSATQVDGANKALYQTVTGQISGLEQQVDKVTDAQVSNLGTLSGGPALLALPGALATQNNGGIVDYNLGTGQIEDGALKSGNTILAAINTGKTVVAYNGLGLDLWTPATGAETAAFTQDVPPQNDFGGLSWYPTNSRAYVLDKKNGRVLSYLVSGNNISRPVVSVNDPKLQSARSLAIDGSIYAYGSNGISKYLSGQPAAFTAPFLTTPLSGQGKIYTEKNFKDIYVLDSGNNRIVIMDKTGRLAATLTSSQFTRLVDFYVDEAGKAIYVLNGSTLLKVAIP